MTVKFFTVNFEQIMEKFSQQFLILLQKMSKKIN